MDPEVLLLDEPTSALDGDRTERLSQLLRNLLGEGVALITVTHDAPFAAALGATIYRLDHARILPA
jgi:ABC-type polar amino acid transport system ATPase subunit